MNQFSFSPVGQPPLLVSADTAAEPVAGGSPLNSVDLSRSKHEGPSLQLGETVSASNNRRAEANVVSTTEHRSRSRSGPSSSVLGQRIRAERNKLGLSQRELADALRAAGWMIGIPNGCTKRLVQKWERGDHACLSPTYQLAFEHLTGIEYGALMTPTSSWHVAKASHALEGCIARLAAFSHDLVQLHLQLTELQAYLKAIEHLMPLSHPATPALLAPVAAPSSPGSHPIPPNVAD